MEALARGLAAEEPSGSASRLDGEALLDRLAPLVDPQCGVIHSLAPMRFPPHEGRHLSGFTARVAAVEALRSESAARAGNRADSWGYGTAADPTTARVRAVCEGLERYCAVSPPPTVLNARARALGMSIVDPRRLPGCSPRERARARPEHRLRVSDPDGVEAWVAGYSVTRREPVWVPLTAAYMGLPLTLRDHLVYPESTGFATGTSYRSAVLSGLCEVIERDSFALWWCHQLPVPRLDPAGLTASASDLIHATERAGLRTTVLDLTSDLGVPVALVVQCSNRGAPYAVVSVACRLDVAAAAVRAIEEAGSLRLALRANDRPAVDVRAGLPASPAQFGALYAGPDGPARLDFVHSGRLRHRPARGPDTLDTVVDRLAAAGAEVIAVDVTQPELREFGVIVVRVIVPELMRISFCHHIRYLAHPRLYAAPARMGYGERTEDGVTDDPHPLA